MRALPVIGALLVFCSCASGEAEPNVAATVDTLPNGALHVTSAPEGAWSIQGDEPWRLVEELRIGAVDGTGPDVFGSIFGVIPDSLGRIWVMDPQASELRLFDADGEFVRTVGGEGEGPGELGPSPCAFPGPGGEVWVESGGRWHRFDSAGVFIVRLRRQSNLICGQRLWLPDGRLLARHSEYLVEYQMGESGDLIAQDTISDPERPEYPQIRWEAPGGRPRIISAVPLIHRPSRVLGPPGDYWIAEGGGDYRIRRQSLTGDTLLVMERPYEPVPVPDSLRAREIAGLDREGFTLVSDFDPDDVPRVYPPFDRYNVATDGTLWVRRQLEGGAYGLDVFAPDGRFLGAVQPPPDFERMSIQHVTPDHMYGILRDELGVPYVVRLGIRKGEG